MQKIQIIKILIQADPSQKSDVQSKQQKKYKKVVRNMLKNYKIKKDTTTTLF